MSQKEVRHTPGPWTQEGSEIKNGDCRPIATIRYEFTRYGDPARSEVLKEDRANAYLILAAPEMLEALKLSLDIIDSQQSPEHYSIVKSAIRKAEGL